MSNTTRLAFVLCHIFTRLCYQEPTPNDWADVNSLYLRFRLRPERVTRATGLLSTCLTPH